MLMRIRDLKVQSTHWYHRASDKAVDQIAEARVIKADHTGEYDYDFSHLK